MKNRPPVSFHRNIWLGYVAPILVWMGFIFFLSAQPSLPGLETPFYDFFLKKIAHMFVYGVLYWLVLRTIRTTHPTRSSLQLWIPFLVVVLYAVSDEYHQTLVPGRTGTVRDVGYDTLGAMIAFLRNYRYI